MRVENNLRPIAGSTRTVLIVSATVLLVLPLVLYFAFSDELYRAYLRQFVAPQLEKTMGFRGEVREFRDGTNTHRAYILVAVDPKGLLGKAGVKPGHMPCRYHHGQEVGFLSDLNSGRGRMVRLRLCDEHNDFEVHVNVPAAN